MPHLTTHNTLHRSRRLGTAWIALAAVLCLQARLAAQTAEGLGVRPDEDTQETTALQATIQGVANLRTRLVNTVSTVRWPVLPQEDLEEEIARQSRLRSRTVGPEGRVHKGAEIRIRNELFRQKNTGTVPTLIMSPVVTESILQPVESVIPPAVRAQLPVEPRSLAQEQQVYEILFRSLVDAGLSVQEAAETTVDYRRLREILRYGGAELDVALNDKVVRHPDLVWVFTPYIRTLNNHAGYRFGVTAVSEEVNLTLDPQDGKEQRLKFTLEIIPGSTSPPSIPGGGSVQSVQQVEPAQEELETGVGEENPLLLLLGMPSFSALGQQANDAILTTGRASAITGILTSGRENESVTGVNVLLPGRASREGQLGVTAGIARNSRLYVGPSVTLGDGLLVLSVGPVLGDRDKDNNGVGRIAGVASLDLSRLLFGKPRTSPGPRVVDIPPSEIEGLYSSRRILGDRGVLALTGGPAGGDVVLLRLTGGGRASGPQPLGPDGSLFVDLAAGDYQITVRTPDRKTYYGPHALRIPAGVVVPLNLAPGGAPPPPAGTGMAPAGTLSPPVAVPAPVGGTPGPGTVPVGEANLRVLVSSEQEGPLAKARVQIYQQELLVEEAVTDGSGWAYLKVEEGAYKIQVFQKGYRAPAAQSVTIAPQKPGFAAFKLEK